MVRNTRLQRRTDLIELSSGRANADFPNELVQFEKDRFVFGKGPQYAHVPFDGGAVDLLLFQSYVVVAAVVVVVVPVTGQDRTRNERTLRKGPPKKKIEEEDVTRKTPDHNMPLKYYIYKEARM